MEVLDAPRITPEMVAEHGLSDEEYSRILKALGREPNLVELGIFSVMWSEHCSYKSSRVHLKKLPTEAPWVICGPGENAGVIDIGDGDAAIFKMESHNHPSYIEPYQGAATGVGGILRDVFTMGARPVANLNALRFGRPDHPKTRHLVAGVVAGIGGYGNCVGVPTVGGEVNFDAAYDGNILVNAMTVGVAKTDKIFYSAAAGIGNSVVYVGSKTGREGEAEAIFRKWELDFAVIGQVTDTGRMELVWDGEIVADIPLGPLADDAPCYERPYAIPKAPEPLTDVPESTDIAADLLKLMASPALASRRWVWEQYDQSVGADTVQRPGGDAAVVRVHGSKKALAITTDCTPRYCYADPVEGGKQAVAEAYRNLCAVGAKPLAITNCLNFGNPQRPEIMGQFVGCIEGMAEACRALDFPVVSGNVSLYDETKGEDGSSLAILPTPAIGGVGLLEDWQKSATIGFKERNELIILIGADASANVELGQSLWLEVCQGRRDGAPPSVDL